MMWRLPKVIGLMRQPAVRVAHLHRCQFVSHWRKATTIMSGVVDPGDLIQLERTCEPDRRGLCSRAGRPHIVLRGAKLKNRKALDSLCGYLSC